MASTPSLTPRVRAYAHTGIPCAMEHTRARVNGALRGYWQRAARARDTARSIKTRLYCLSFCRLLLLELRARALPTPLALYLYLPAPRGKMRWADGQYACALIRRRTPRADIAVEPARDSKRR